MAHQTNPTVNRGYTFQLLSFINIPLIMVSCRTQISLYISHVHQHHPPASHLSNSHTPHLYDVVQCLPIDRIMFTFVYSSSLVSYDCNLTSLPNFHCNAHSWKFVGSRFQTPISNWFPFLANLVTSWSNIVVTVEERRVPLGELGTWHQLHALHWHIPLGLWY